MPLRFSKELDAHNPNTPEWREDIGLVVTRLLSKVHPALVLRLPHTCGHLSKAGGRGGLATSAHSHSGLAFRLAGRA